ncbi:MAG: HAD family phosphatase [Bacteroidales bacterium]|nr:HAD family phosphatase [Bacteroidales bacterium]
MPKAIVFDIGGVLIGLNMDRCIAAFRDGLGFERITQLLDPYHQKGIYGELEGGRLSEQHFKDLVIAESRPGITPEDVDNAMGQLLEQKIDPRTVRAVNEVKGKYPLYLLSNNNPISMRHCRRVLRDNGLDPESTFRDQFISSDLKLMKPAPEFYNYAIQKIGLPPQEILFIDDNKANVDGARAVGMDARLFNPGTDLGLLLLDC